VCVCVWGGPLQHGCELLRDHAHVLGSAIDKLYNLVINARLMTSKEDNDKLHDGQQDFRPGRSAVDNIYMLKTCFDARCQQKLDTYILFVDIEKAYDTVWRAGLLWHLWQKGVTGKLFCVLANMHHMIDSTPWWCTMACSRA
jgi:hypothetical protein